MLGGGRLGDAKVEVEGGERGQVVQVYNNILDT